MFAIQKHLLTRLFVLCHAHQRQTPRLQYMTRCAVLFSNVSSLKVIKAIGSEGLRLKIESYLIFSTLAIRAKGQKLQVCVGFIQKFVILKRMCVKGLLSMTNVSDQEIALSERLVVLKGSV